MIFMENAEKMATERFGIDLNDSGATHVPVLIFAFYMTIGDVLELGTGENSTKVLHELCKEQGRRLVSYEASEYYYDKAVGFSTDLHDIILVGDYGEAKIDKEWGLVFVDHRPATRRIIDIDRLKNRSDCIVCHDTEPKSRAIYNYESVFPDFLYRWDYTKPKTHTTMLGNRRSLWNKFLGL